MKTRNQLLGIFLFTIQILVFSIPFILGFVFEMTKMIFGGGRVLAEDLIDYTDDKLKGE